jgi:hypothetical protein
MNNILRTIIRFAIILVFLVLLVFLSITLFKIIPAGINQLATASLSITGLSKDATTTPATTDRIPQSVATTTGGLNGVIQSTGDIIIKENTPPTTVVNQPTRVVYTQPRTVYYPAPKPVLTGLKNIKTTLLAVGIIDRYSGQFVSTNSYTTDDTIVVKYQISNDQDTATGPFSMRVDMPALGINDKTKYINNINIPGKSSYSVEARFNGLDTSMTPAVRIYTDVNGNVAETNENDNNLSVTINNVVNNNNNNYNCNYYNNCNNNNYDCNYYNNCNVNQGQPNLTITSVQAGKFVSGIFYPQNTFSINETVFVQLRVRNTGGSFTNTWSTRTTYYDQNGSFREKTTTGERYLSSGEETTLTYSIPSVNRGNTTLNINIDSNNNIFETNESDNGTSLGIYMY